MALSAAQNTWLRGPSLEYISLPVAQAQHIQQGDIVCLNSGSYLVPGANTSGFFGAGVSLEDADNTSGTDGTIKCKIIVRGQALLSASVVGATVPYGSRLYCQGNGAVAVSGSLASNGIHLGYCMESGATNDSTATAGSYWVDIRPDHAGLVSGQ